MTDHRQIVAWTQWPELPLSDRALGSVELLSSPDGIPTAEQRERITFYVPRYLSGHRGLAPVSDMPHLQVLQLANAGFDDAAEYARAGLTICNARGVHDEATAELAVALTLAGRRGFSAFAVSQGERRWRRAHFPSVADSRIAVIGHGAVGSTISRMLAGFAVSVTAFTRSGFDGAQPVEQLPELIGQFDIVILALPLNADSAGMFDAELLAKMADGSLLVNVARGGIVVTDALVAELESGRLHAAVDVTDPEPLPDGHPLWSAPNCFITPHVGGDTSAFFPRMRGLIGEQLDLLAAGSDLANIVIDGVA